MPPEGSRGVINKVVFSAWRTVVEMVLTIAKMGGECGTTVDSAAPWIRNCGNRDLKRKVLGNRLNGGWYEFLGNALV